MTPEQLLIELRTTSAELVIITSAVTDKTMTDNLNSALLQLHKAIRRAEFLSTTK